MDNKTEVKKSKTPLYMRILAMLLVLIFAGDLVIIGLANVNYNADDYTDGELEDMAYYIARTDEYINAGLVQRIRKLLGLIGTPETFDELYMASSVALADEDYAKAADYLGRGLELFTGEDSVLSRLNVKQGCIYALNNQWDSAAGYFEDAVRLDGTNADAYLMLAQIRYREENYTAAAAAMREYAALTEPDAQGYSLMASAMLFAGEYADARAACDGALKQDDCDRAAMYFMRSKADFFLGDYPACRDDAQKALDAGYDYTEGMTMKAAAYEGEKDYAGVLGVLMEMIDSGIEDGTVYQNALTCAMEVDDYAAQEKIITRLLEYETDDSTELTLRSSLAMAQIEQSEFSEALENLEFCIKAQKDNTELVYLRGICYMNLDKYNEAYRDFTTVLTAEKLIDECYYNRALCRLGMGQKLAAQSELKEIIKRNESEKMVSLAQALMESS